MFFPVFILVQCAEICQASQAICHILRLPRWLSSKESSRPCRRQRRREFSPWVRKITYRRKWPSTLDFAQKSARKIFLPTKSHGQRGLVGYNPWGHKELDTTQWLSMQTHLISNFGLFSKSSKNKTFLSVLTSIIFCNDRNVLYIALFNPVLLATHSCLERETWLVFE